MSMDYVAIGNDELGGNLGEAILCPQCGAYHQVENSDPPMLQFYKCGGTTYLAGIDGRSVMERFAKKH